MSLYVVCMLGQDRSLPLYLGLEFKQTLADVVVDLNKFLDASTLLRLFDKSKKNHTPF